MGNSLEGINEKLKRSYESIINLNGEIKTFFDEGLYPLIPDENDERFSKALDYLERRPIPLRFGVLAGEIVHHLRSCLDHLAWLLSSEAYRSAHRTSIEFPVFEREPRTKEKLAGYDRKVKGMSPKAREIIWAKQPFYLSGGRDASEQPLAVLHRLDRFDKHVDLVVTFVAFNVRLAPSVLRNFATSDETKAMNARGQLKTAVNVDKKITSHVALKDPGTSEIQAAIPLLGDLADVVREIVLELSSEIRV